MLRYEGISNFHHEAEKQHEGFIGWLGVVEALTRTAMEVSDGFHNLTSEQVGRFHSEGMDAVAEGHDINAALSAALHFPCKSIYAPGVSVNPG